MRYLHVLPLIWCGLIVACVSSSPPAKAGMDVAAFRASCVAGKAVLNTFGGARFGECEDKPSEYVLFESGQVVAILSTEKFIEKMTASICAPSDEPCPAEVAQVVREREADKASAGTSARSQAQSELLRRVGDGLGAMGDSLRATDDSFETTSASSGLSCPLKAERISGSNRICVYDCLGSADVVTIPATSFCEIFVSR